MIPGPTAYPGEITFPGVPLIPDTPEVIVAPDVEGILCDWLPDQLTTRGYPGTPVTTRIPTTRPPVFVRVIRTGGPMATPMILDNPQLTVEAWAGTETGAVTLIAVVRGLINSLPGRTVGGTVFYRVTEFSGPANLPDPESNQVRYTYTTSILLRARPI